MWARTARRTLWQAIVLAHCVVCAHRVRTSLATINITMSAQQNTPFNIDSHLFGDQDDEPLMSKSTGWENKLVSFVRVLLFLFAAFFCPARHDDYYGTVPTTWNNAATSKNICCICLKWLFMIDLNKFCHVCTVIINYCWVNRFGVPA